VNVKPSPVKPRALKESAEGRFRDALARLVSGTTIRIAIGSEITQNNVAREAGVHPSALRSSRYPLLIPEIHNAARQSLIDNRRAGPSIRALKRDRRDERQRYLDMKHQRDQAAALLASADAEILRLMLIVRDLEQRVLELEGSTSPSFAKPTKLIRLPRR